MYSNKTKRDSMKLPEHITNLPAYTPIEPFDILSARIGRSPQDIIKLDANENPYGMSPRARKALAELEFPHIYPDPESRALRSALEAFTSVPAANLLPGSGADELIDLIMRVVLEPGQAIINCPPTFGMYAFDADLNAARIIDVPRRQDFSVDVERVIAQAEKHAPRLIFLTTPNNPDGSLIKPTELDRLLNLPALIVLDEAYIEFADPHGLGKNLSRISEVPRRDNLIVLRTFSKLAGLAGLRVGYGAFPTWLMPTLWKAKQPYNVNVAASTAAIAALEDTSYLEDIVSRLVADRERMRKGLENIPYLSPYPSNSNFILCRVIGRDAAMLKASLANDYGIFIRYFNKTGLQDCIRISVGRPEQIDAVLKALVELQKT